MPRFTGLRGPQHGEQDRGQDPCNTDQNRKLIMDKRWQRLPGSRTEPLWVKIVVTSIESETRGR